MDKQDMLGVLLSMTEQQQKAIAEAVEELKKQTASLNGVAPDLQKAVQAAIVAALAREVWATLHKERRPPLKRP
jgi:methyl-accepting chemotaxis protein